MAKSTKAQAHMERRPTVQDEEGEPLFGTKLEHQIETERARLRKAEGCLDCLRAAIEYGVEIDSDSDCELSDMGDVADIARELVHEAINALDSVNLDYPRHSPRGR